jgi:predicted permease
VLLPASRREEIEGDLVELWARARERGRFSAAVAFWRHAASIAPRRRRLARLPQAVRDTDVRTDVLFEQICSDLRYSARLMRRQPAFAALTVAALTLGIGASTAVFTIADRVLLRPLPYPEPNRIVALTRVSVGFSPAGAIIAPEFTALREFSALGMYGSGGLNLGDAPAARRVNAAAVNSGFFDVLGVRPFAGRTFTTEEDHGLKVIVIGFDLWRQAFSGDRTVLDRTIRVNGQAFTVIGIMPRGFSFPERAEVWIPPTADRQVTGAVYSPRVLARLARGVGPAQAVAALTRAIEHRNASSGNRVYPFGVKPSAAAPPPPTVASLQSSLSQGARPTLGILVVIVFLLLAAACANVGGLLLSRLRMRERELLVRLALGANRGRLIQQLVTESLLLSAAGTLAGLGLGFWAVGLFAASVPSFVPDMTLTGLDPRFFAIGGLVSVLCTGAFSLGPAIAASSAPASRIVNDAGDSRRPSRRFASLLIVSQVAAALLLLAATSASTSTVLRLMHLDLGFSKDRTIVFDLTLPQTQYRGAAIGSFVERLEDRLRLLPGVVNIGTNNFALGSNRRMIAVPLWLDGEENAPSASTSRDSFAIRLAASPGYFQAMGIPLVAGRHFTDADRKGSPRVAILSESAARKLNPEIGNLVGKRLALDEKVQAEIVGIVGDVRLFGPTSRPTLELYEPIAQSNYLSALTLAIDSTASTGTVVAATKQALAELDSTVPIYNVQPLGDVRARFLETERITAALSAMFALLALTLCGIGLYGVLSQLVAQRTREIGIRVALGADRRRLRWSVVAAGLRLTVAGIIVGAIGARLAFHAAASFLPELAPPEPGTIAVNVVILVGVAASAAWLPARRASSVDPVRALRTD